MRYLLVWIVIFLSGVLFSCKTGTKIKDRVEFPYEFSGIKFNKNEISFGKVFMGEVVCDTLFLYNPLAEKVECRFRVLENFVQVVPEKEVIFPGDTVRVFVRFFTERRNEYGNYREYISFFPSTREQGWSPPLMLTAEVIENFMNLTAEEKQQAPKAVFDIQTFDFGDIREGNDVSHVFCLKNEGLSNLLIRRIEASCGCTAVVPDSRVVPMGDSCNIQVTFRTKGREGKQFKTIQITTNDYRRSNMILKIRANVIRDKK